MVTLNTCSHTLIDLMLETHQIRNGAFELPGLDPDPIRVVRDVSAGRRQLTIASWDSKRRD